MPVEAKLNTDAYNQTSPNVLDRLKPEQAIRLAKKKIKEGSFEDAKGIYKDILVKFPKNKKAIDGIKTLSGGSIAHVSKNQEPPQDQQQHLVNLYQHGQLQQILDKAKQWMSQFPNSVTLHSMCGAAHAGLGHIEAAIESYKSALNINPSYAEAHNNLGKLYYNMGIGQQIRGESEAAIGNFKKSLKIVPNHAQSYLNMGNAQKSKGDLEAAIGSYRQALHLKSDYMDAYYNLAVLLQEKGNLKDAIDNYESAVKLNPDYAEAYNNMGTALSEQGDIDAAIDSFERSLSIKPDYAEAHNNMLQLLPFYAPPKKVSSNDTLKINQSIRRIDMKDNSLHIISDDQVVNLFSKSSGYIKNYGLELKTEPHQTYRINSVDLNCERHMAIFNEYDIVPEFCFGCYKVQVEPRSVIELIKLYVVFDQLKLNKNNSRKCMIELRPEISGFYKGLIYCSGLEEANQIAKHLDGTVQQRIGLGLHPKVKRGCSEYSMSFPDYQEINNSGPQLMNYRDEWHVIEEAYDSENPVHAKETIRQSVPGFNLTDVLIIQKWIDYAKGIGDTTANQIDQGAICYQDIYDQAKARLDHFQFNS
jgi:tetratricopeptide (TPR) repeat protein